jgi:hypothetical protein
VDAYRDLPEDLQNDIRYSKQEHTYIDAPKFDYILGFAYNRHNKYILYSFINSSKVLLSITILRAVFRQTNTDNKIKAFCENINKIILEPRKLLIIGFKVRRYKKSRRYIYLNDKSNFNSDFNFDFNSGYYFNSFNIFVLAKNKGRR